jgi:hypothetical protein
MQLASFTSPVNHKEPFWGTLRSDTSGWPDPEFSYLCDITRATRSRIFCGHDFLKTAPRFSCEVPVASKPWTPLRERFFEFGDEV